MCRPVSGTSAVGTKYKSSSMILVEIVGELGQLPRAVDRGGLDHEGQVLLAVALADVQVEHPGDQRALQARARAAQNVEARAGQLGAALEVDDAQSRAEVPVRLGCEVEFARLADGRMTTFSLSSLP